MRCDLIRRVLVVVVAGLPILPATLFSQQKALGYYPPADAEVAKSHARVVRLSYVSGTVTLRRSGGAEEEKGLLNMPIQEGFELSTADSSYAEVEFENGSTARVGELSKLLFNQLALDANGNKLNGMTFEQGYATFNFVPERRSAKQNEWNSATRLQANDQDIYRVKIADATVKADGKCEFRTDLAQDAYRVEVFKGSVEVATDNQSTKLGEGKVLEQKTGSPLMASNVRKGIVKDAWDQWSEARDRQAQLTVKDEAVHPTGASYGWSDLNTYGEWLTLPGGRFGWSPYAQAGWSPYTYGTWALYPGMGWAWISADPWGWVTDHCGLWDFDPMFGWFWMNPMFGCGFWNPSLVNWYMGPGWLGWQPIRPTHFPPGRPRPVSGPQTGHRAREILTVPATVVQNRQMITPQMVDHIPAKGATKIEQPPFEPSPRTVPEGNPAVATATRGPAGSVAPRLGFTQATAPTTILMGGDAAKESLLLAHHGLRSNREPLRAAQGTTLGGRYQVYGSAGEFRGSAEASGGRNGRMSGVGGPNGGLVIPGRSGGSGPVVASHGSSGGGSSRSGGGGVSSYSGGGGGGVHSSGGGGGTVSSGGVSAGGGGGHH